MLESLAVALLKTIVVFIFESSVRDGTNVNVEGAPDWYMKDERGSLCVSTHAYGYMSAVEEAKDKLYPKMEEELRRLIKKAVYENFREVKNQKERRFILSVVEDSELSLFVEGNLRVKNVEYDRERGIAFARGCISREDFVTYEKARVKEIAKSLSEKRAEEAFEELEMIK